MLFVSALKEEQLMTVGGNGGAAMVEQQWGAC
jgi:hypothetical protein